MSQLNDHDHLVGRTREISNWLLIAAAPERPVTPLDVLMSSDRIASVPDEPQLLPGDDILWKPTVIVDVLGENGKCRPSGRPSLPQVLSSLPSAW